MEKIDIEIPGELFTSGDKEINFDLLKNKTLIGFCGYARSGKDTIGNMMVKRLGFKRISFGDVLKADLDEYMRPQIFEDLKSKGIDLEFEDVNFMSPKSIEIKEMLRPYMIWFGETMKINNGLHHWTNRALSEIGDNEKVVVTDVRRINELELFKYNREQHARKINHLLQAGVPDERLTFFKDNENSGDLESLLIHINQYGLTDADSKTVDTIRKAHEEWLFDYTVFVDSRIQETARKTYMEQHLRSMVEKYPNYFI